MEQMGLQQELYGSRFTALPVMSTPDALPTEIALIALLLFKFQVYSTSLCHYYHRPVTLSTF
jgi:hypothetical protein